MTPSCGPGVSNFVGGLGLCTEVVAVGGRGVNKGGDCASRVEGHGDMAECLVSVTFEPGY